MRAAISGNVGLNALNPALYFLVALGAGFLAAWVLGPGPGTLPSLPVDAAELFDPDDLAYWRDYRDRVRLIAVGGLVAELVLLAGLTFFRGRGIDRLLARLSSRVIIGPLVIGVGLAVALALVGLPFSLLGWRTGVEFGLVTNPFTGWLTDQALALLVSAALAGLAAVVAFWAWRRLGRHFWLALWAIAVVLALATAWLWPIVISPLFNRYQPIEDGPLKADVERLAARTDTDFGGLYTVDASRRSNAVNAYVTGVGASRRVVIYDRVPEELDRAELQVLIAHELAHVEAGDVLRAVAFVALVAPFGALAIQRATSATLGRRGFGSRDPGVLLPLAFFTTIAVLLISIPGAWLSRQVETQADERALELTGRPAAAIALQKRLTRENLGDPDPPPIYHAIFGTHPPAVERIGIARSWRKEGRP